MELNTPNAGEITLTEELIWYYIIAHIRQILLFFTVVPHNLIMFLRLLISVVCDCGNRTICGQFIHRLVISRTGRFADWWIRANFIGNVT